MIQLRQDNAHLISCDIPGCTYSALIYLEPVTSQTQESTKVHLIHVQAEHNYNWFIERFPNKLEREICPIHADRYRTLFMLANKDPE